VSLESPQMPVVCADSMSKQKQSFGSQEISIENRCRYGYQLILITNLKKVHGTCDVQQNFLFALLVCRRGRESAEGSTRTKSRGGERACGVSGP
jgi:hypothetical protein